MTDIGNVAVDRLPCDLDCRRAATIDPWPTLVRSRPGTRTTQGGQPARPWASAGPRPEAKNLKDKGTFVLVGTTGECTVPMEVSRYDSQPSAEDEIYVVWEHSHCSSMGGEPSWSRRRSPGLLYGVELKRDSRDDARLHLTDNRYGTIRATGNDLYVPEGWRLIRCEKDDYGPMESSGTDKEEDKKPKPIKLVLGRNVDVSQAIFSKMASLRSPTTAR